jgi:hypothetical protein
MADDTDDTSGGAPTADGASGYDGAGLVARWIAEIRMYERAATGWEGRSKKLIKRYKDERGIRDGAGVRYNVLWSNVQTLLPAIYARTPKPDIERRFKDADKVGRYASQVLERCVDYFVQQDGFNATVRQAVLDYLLPGRGTTWVRYEPRMQQVPAPGDELGQGGQVSDDVKDPETLEMVEFEDVVTDYVHWSDFGHTVARTWEEVRCVWRRVYLTREELRKRFGEVGDEVPLDYSPRGVNDEKIPNASRKACVYEIWDKAERRAMWIHKDFPKPLDVRDDPLRLPDFWPCPRPLLANLANDSCIPTPDYVQYQDQASELDNITERIGALTKSIKVAGVYDASVPGLARILSEGIENKLIPVESWSMFAEKGGLKGSIDLLPLQDVVNALLALHEAREKVKQDLYEITGLSDIIRGATKAAETATAQQIKGQFASLRLSDRQADIQRFVRELVRITAVIIAEHFSLETIRKISGVRMFSAQEKQQLQMMQQQGMPPPPGLAPDELQELMDAPTWEEVEALLRDDAARAFRIDIETDSTIKADEEAEKASRIEFLQAAGQFLQQTVAAGMQTPALTPLLAQMLMFGVRGFKAGKELEGSFESAMRKLEQQAAQPQEPKPDPEMMRIQAQQQAAQQQMQIDRERNAMEAARDKERTDANLRIEQMKHQMTNAFDEWKAKLDAETKIVVAAIQAKAQPSAAGPDEAMEMAMQGGQPFTNAPAMPSMMNESPSNPQGAMASFLHEVVEHLDELMHAHSGPKMLAYDEMGRPAGVHVMPREQGEQEAPPVDPNEAMGRVAQRLAMLKQRAQQPRELVRDETGRLVGIR